MLPIIAIIVGFVFLIRSCLSTYDEYTLEGNAYIFTQPAGNLVTYIKGHFDVSYYSQEGGVTNISGTHYYYLETRNALSLDLLKRTKLEGKGAKMPAIVGNSGKVLWIYDKQLKAFDPFTHTILCDENKLVQLNPALRGILPLEFHYYTYDYTGNCLEVFTKNASTFRIGNDFIATPVVDNDNAKPKALTLLESKLKQCEAFRNSPIKQPNGSHWRDTIEKIKKHIELLEDTFQEQQEFRKRLNKIQEWQYSSIDGIISNSSVQDSVVFALIPLREMDTTNTSLSVQHNFSADEQRFLCKAQVRKAEKSSGEYSWINVGKWSSINPSHYFLNGNFLLDKRTLQPIVLHDPEGWLIVSVKEIGQNSPLLLHRVSTNGKIQWSKELPITSLDDLLVVPGKAVVFCCKPSFVSDKRSHFLLSVDFQTGNYKIADLKN